VKKVKLGVALDQVVDEFVVVAAMFVTFSLVASL